MVYGETYLVPVIEIGRIVANNYCFVRIVFTQPSGPLAHLLMADDTVEPLTLRRAMSQLIKLLFGYAPEESEIVDLDNPYTIFHQQRTNTKQSCTS